MTDKVYVMLDELKEYNEYLEGKLTKAKNLIKKLRSKNTTIDSKYEYSFVLRILSNVKYDEIVYEIFRMEDGRISLIWTEKEFYSARGKLSEVGFEMCEIERALYQEPETIL